MMLFLPGLIIQFEQNRNRTTRVKMTTGNFNVHVKLYDLSVLTADKCMAAKSADIEVIWL